MARCATCTTIILFGGVRADGRRYCSRRCHEGSVLVTAAEEVPDDAVRRAVEEVRMGLCPLCGGYGPVDVSTAHRIWSAVLVSSWYPVQSVCCRRCGRRRQGLALLVTLVAGWWSFPWGLVMTPVQAVRNVRGLLRDYDPYVPSEELETVVRMQLAMELLPDLDDRLGGWTEDGVGVTRR